MRPWNLLNLVRLPKQRKNHPDVNNFYIRLFIILSMISIPFPVLYYFTNMGTSVPITDVRRGLLALTLMSHLALHGLSATFKTHTLRMVAYLVIQFGLLAALSVLVNTPLVLIFNTPLLGEVILMFDVIWIAFLEMLFAYSVYIVMLTVIYHFNGAIFIQFFGPGLLLSTISVLPYLGVLILQAATRRRSDQLVTELRAACQPGRGADAGR